MSTRLEPSTAPAGEQALGATRGLCNTCGRLCDARIVLDGERVLLVKWCPDHGRSTGLVSTDRDGYLRSLAYVKPGTSPRVRAVAERGVCPDACGLCPAHEQHTCVPILEITGRCDLDCPVCLVSGHERPELTVEQVRSVVDRLLAYEGRVNMLNLSGGEPTLHPDFLAVVDEARRPEVGILSVSTNGLRLARDEELTRALVDRGVVISLQLDGLEDGVYTALRGRRGLPELKQRLVERVVALGGRMSLTFTLARGVNEHGLQAALDLLLAHDEIVSLMVQPLAHVPGALAQPWVRPEEPVTIPDAVRLLADASRGVLSSDDFTPLPCSHPSCFALTYLLKTEQGGFVSLPSVVDTGAYLDIIKNQALLSTDPETLGRIKDALYALWSSDGVLPHRDGVLRTVKRLLVDLNALGGRASHREYLDLGARNVKSIFIHQFMDRASFDLSRAIKCCNHYPQIDGRLLPACVRNNLRPRRGEGG